MGKIEEETRGRVKEKKGSKGKGVKERKMEGGNRRKAGARIEKGERRRKDERKA